MKAVCRLSLYFSISVQFVRAILKVLDQKERTRLFVHILLDVIISALDVIFLALTIIIINFYIKNAGLPYISFLPRSLGDNHSVLLIAMFFVLFAVKNLFAYSVSASNFRFIYSVSTRLSNRNIRYYLKDNYLEYIHTDSAIHIRRICHQPIEFGTYILTNFQQIISQAVLVFFVVCGILVYNASLFVLLLVLLMPAVGILAWLIKRKLKHVRRSIKKANELTLKNLKEALAGYVESNVYNKETFFAERYDAQQEQLNQNISVQQTLQALPSRLIEVFAIFGFFVLIVINKLSANEAGVDLLTIGVFVVAAYKIIPGIVKILNCAGQMKTYEFVLNDLLTVNTSIETAVPKNAIDKINSIHLEKIHFGYNGHPILNGAGFEIRPGDFAGLSGYSGKGKTTLIHILLGFIEQQDGVVSINNKITPADERRRYWTRISYIKQQPFFIHDTVQKNITLQEGGHDEEKLKHAILFSGLDTLINEHIEGKYLMITENGKNLSGGQRQRVMLARALYHEFDVLILDEPFGELDQESENDILNRLKMLAAEGKLIIFITHNKTSLNYCNKIFHLDA